MTKFKLILLLILFLNTIAYSQTADFIVLKKHGRAIHSYFEGSPMSFSTNSSSYSAVVDHIANDTVYFIQYDVRRMPTRLGVYVLDTMAVYRMTFHYKDVVAISKQKYGFSKSAAGATLLGTGGLLTVLGAGSWLVTKKDTRYYARPEFVAGCAALTGLGYLLLKTSDNNYRFGKKYKLEYIRTK